MREASSRRLLAQLWEGGATVRAYDPEAMHESQRIFGERADLVFCSSADDALQGADALVVVGTTGESPTVSMEEHAELIRVAVEHAAGRIPVIAGVGANSTDEAIHLTRHAKAVGAQAGLSVVPYYNKPSQEGLYRHFRTIAEAVDLPTILCPASSASRTPPATSPAAASCCAKRRQVSRCSAGTIPRLPP
ncbi:hypothetical protein G6F68_012820 [Rhizopus microsporus]|nr:hypothetical protein G6F68_012820 [Rhizopus microsporus]